MIFDIKRYAINDGPGIRTAVFMKGCPLDCWWCHNPEGQGQEPQIMFRSNRCKSSQACLDVCPRGAISWNEGPLTNWEACDHCGKCANVCFAEGREIIGREISVDQLWEEVSRDIPFYDESGGGVTFTGGEPLLQSEFMEQALVACKKQNIHTTIDTSGHASWNIFKSILPLVDLFLYDIKLMDAAKHKKYTSVSNRMILDNLKKLSGEKAAIIVRIPLIPGVNDDAENIERCAYFLASLPHLAGVELMPYHTIGVAKYLALGMKYRMANTISPTQAQIIATEKILSGCHLPVIKQSSGRTK